MDKDSITSLASEFTAPDREASNDARCDPARDLEPHEHLQEIMNAEIQGFIRDFRISMISILRELNEQTYLTKQSGELEGKLLQPEDVLNADYVEVGLAEPFQKLLWRVVVTSYRDHLLNNDHDRFCKIYEPLGVDALAFFLRTKTHDPAHYNTVMNLFSDAYAEDLKAFSVIKTLILQNVKGVDVRIEMREPANGWVLPVAVITTQNPEADVRSLLQAYIDSSHGRHGLSLQPA